ncbi:MAG: hypothetical protein DHS20C16_04950 [Phycisphaerae bacterium]|nr:MAG: hypothetical protein DHS20C16_04950 [Phycisphaerae bacterium]
MAADLRIRGSFASASVLLFDDHLVQLEHSHTSDRVRRIRYDRVESVVHWRVIPVGRTVLFGLLLGLPGLGMSLSSEPVFQGLGIFFVALMIFVVGRYLYLKRSNIRITRAGRDFTISGIVSPKKIRRLIERLEINIRKVQERPTEPAAAVQIEEPDTYPAE